MAQASKEQLVIILDVGKSMSQSHSNTSSLEGAIKAVNLLVQQKLLFGKKDEIGVVLFGTPGTTSYRILTHLTETKNNLSENGYEHIVVLRDISIPDLELVRQIENINPGGEEGDLLDALIVGMDMLINAAQSIKKTTTVSRRIFLVTDAGNKINKDGLKIVVDQFMKMQAKLNIIGVNFDDDDSNKSETKLENEGLLKEIGDKVGGVIVAVSEAIDMMSYFRSVSVVQKSTFRGMLEISSKIQIPIWSYLKTYEQKFPSLNKISVVSQQSANPGTLSVIQERTYQSSTEPDTEVAATERVKGYRYGKTLVPFAQTDESMLKYSSNSCLKVIGFTAAKNVPRHHYIGNTECIVPDPRDKDCGVALSSIIHALAETDSVAIVRYCKRKGYSPHLGFLAPHIKADYECLYYTSLPFAEDIRQYSFSSLAPDKARKSVAPTSAQLDAAEKLINDMDLMHNEEREDGSLGESLKPKYTYNPVLQRFYQCVQYRALNPESSLPKLDPLIEKYINPDEQLLQKVNTRIKQFKEEFNLIKSEKKQEKSDRVYWRDNLTANAVKLDSYVPDQNKKRKMEGEYADFSLEEFISNGVSEVGSIKPVDDFKAMLARRDVDLVEKAIEGIKRRITQLVNDSILAQLYPKAIECLLALRQACVQEEESESFNKFLVDLRSYYEGKRRDDFWKLIVAQNITLIDSTESEDSSISADEARQFLSSRKETEIVSKPAVEDTSAEDLFAMVE